MYSYMVVLGALSVGALCGLIPLGIGAANKKLGLGIGAFIICIICGFLGGILLSAPACGVISIVIKIKADKVNKKYCTFCGEKILVEAKVCKHCKHQISDSNDIMQ